MHIPKTGYLEDLLTIVRDPADLNSELSLGQDSHLLTETVVSPTGKTFSFSKGVLDLLCPEIELPDHTPVGDPEWETWKRLQASIFSEFTYSGGASGAIQELGHQAAVKCVPKGGNPWILEIGSGTSHHLLKYTRQYPLAARYINFDISLSNLAMAQDRWTTNNNQAGGPQRRPTAYFVRGSAYNLPFRTQSVDHVLAIYVFEHLKHLKRAVSEFLRVIAMGGTWCMVLPTEGGVAWKLGRKLMYSRQIRQRYGINYDRMMAIEHCNTCLDVIRMVHDLTDCQVTYLPFTAIPSPHLNAVVALRGKVS